MAATKVFARVLFMIFIVGSVDFKKFNRFENILSRSLKITRYSQYELISLRKVGKKPSYDIIEILKVNGIFKYRGSRGGRIRNTGESRTQIPVVIGRRPFQPFRPKRNTYANLIKIKRTGQQNAAEKTGYYTVPKCLFLNTGCPKKYYTLLDFM